MATEKEIIKKASDILGEDTYKPFYVGYFITMNDDDQGGEDYCEKCIDDAVKDYKNDFYKRRREIVKKYIEIEETGYHKGINIKDNYTKEQIDKSRQHELKDYPKPAVFSYEGHDPDFGGGCTEPIICQGCGEYFHTNFTPDLECAKYLLEDFNTEIDARLKWKLGIAFYNFDYCKPEVQKILIQIALLLTNQQSANPVNN